MTFDQKIQTLNCYRTSLMVMLIHALHIHDIHLFPQHTIIIHDKYNPRLACTITSRNHFPILESPTSNKTIHPAETAIQWLNNITPKAIQFKTHHLTNRTWDIDGYFHYNTSIQISKKFNPNCLPLIHTALRLHKSPHTLIQGYNALLNDLHTTPACTSLNCTPSRYNGEIIPTIFQTSTPPFTPIVIPINRRKHPSTNSLNISPNAIPYNAR